MVPQMNLRKSLQGPLFHTGAFVVMVLASLSGRADDARAGLTAFDILGSEAVMDEILPVPATATGIGVGVRHWYHHEIIDYLDSLAAASDRMVSLGEHGRTHGGRPLMAYAISSPANLARIEAIREARPGLADPKTKADRRMPVVVHMGYSVHGDEPSGANAALLIAYILAAGQDPELAAQLEQVVILLNPVFNPDGLDRFAHWTNSLRGAVPSADRLDREHRQVFMTGRTNYYWFDLNRDWLAHQHPESQGRLDLFHQWMPNVQLDFHEMQPHETYFFQPGVPERTHPLTPERNQELTDAMAGFFRETFDQDGTLYYSAERFDDFYMGKASTYPDLFGCVGILFEQASSRGAWQDTASGRLTFELTIQNQVRMSLASLRAAAALKAELLDYQADAFADSLDQGRERGGYYLATADGDPTRLREFVRVLQGHGIEVAQLAATVEIDGMTWPAGRTLAIPLAQPRYLYLQSLWEQRTEFAEDIFYDVSSWTLPLAFNLQYTPEPVARVKTEALTESFPGSTVSRPWMESAVGYLIDWRDSASPRLLNALQEAGASVRVAMAPFTARVAGGESLSFGYGTLLVSRGSRQCLSPVVRPCMKNATEAGLPVHAVMSSSTETGIDLGSRDFRVLRPPRVVLLTGPGFSQAEAGEIWHLMDQRLGLPVTMLDWDRLAGVDLSGYTHVLVVSGSGSLGFLGEDRVAQLKGFVESGGVLWAQGAAVDWALEHELAPNDWKSAEGESDEADEGAASTPVPEVERRPYASARDDGALDLVRGAVYATEVDITHPIGYGYGTGRLPVIRNRNKFLEPSANPYATPVAYAGDSLLAGYCSEANRALASGSAGIVVHELGDGAVILAVDDPCFRAFWWGTQRLLVNGLFFGELLDNP